MAGLARVSDCFFVLHTMAVTVKCEYEATPILENVCGKEAISLPLISSSDIAAAAFFYEETFLLFSISHVSMSALCLHEDGCLESVIAG